MFCSEKEEGDKGKKVMICAPFQVSSWTLRPIITKALFIKLAFFELFVSDMFERAVLDLALLAVLARRHFTPF